MERCKTFECWVVRSIGLLAKALRVVKIWGMPRPRKSICTNYIKRYGRSIAKTMSIGRVMWYAHHIRTIGGYGKLSADGLARIRFFSTSEAQGTDLRAARYMGTRVAAINFGSFESQFSRPETSRHQHGHSSFYLMAPNQIEESYGEDMHQPWRTSHYADAPDISKHFPKHADQQQHTSSPRPMTLDLVFMSGESPPPYSAVAATPLVEQPEFPNTDLPFSHPDRLVVKILALVSEGQTLDSRFKDVRDVASTGTKFEYETTALTLCGRFETLVWESRDIAGAAHVAMKDFNEIVLDFLSEPNVAVQDRLKELANASKLLQRERDSMKNQKSSFDALTKELEDFYRTIHSESSVPIPKKQRQSRSGGRAPNDLHRPRKSRPPFVMPRSEPLNGLSTVTASFGTVSRSCMDYASQIDPNAEKGPFPWCIRSPPAVQETSPAGPNPSEHKRPCPPVNHLELAALFGIVDALLRDLCAFASRIHIFSIIFSELAREQDILVVYLKDGQSIANQGYRSEITRLRKHLPCVCNALDAYSEGRHIPLRSPAQVL